MKRFTKAKARMLALAGLLALPTMALQAQDPGYDLARELRANVVQITTARDDGNAGPGGFGFIVGEQSGWLYIVTAKHVVVEFTIARRFVAFFNAPNNRLEAESVVVRRNEDLAVLRVRTPSGLSWRRDCLALPESIVAGKQVWFIGRGGDWYVPTGPSVGGINTAGANFVIDLEINSVQPGTSGAPVITEDGIVGMIVRDNSNRTAEAFSIEFIKRAFDEWEVYPWSLLPLGEASLLTQLSVGSSPGGAAVRLNGNAVGVTPWDTTLAANVQYALALESDGLVPVTTTIDASPGDMSLVYELRPFQTVSESPEAQLQNVQFTLDETDPSRILVQYDLISELAKKYKVTLMLVNARGEPVKAPLGTRQGDFRKVLPGSGKRIDWQPVHPFGTEVAAVRLTVTRQRSRLVYILGAVGGGALAVAVTVLGGGGGNGGNGSNGDNGGFPLPPTRPGGQ